MRPIVYKARLEKYIDVKPIFIRTLQGATLPSATRVNAAGEQKHVRVL